MRCGMAPSIPGAAYTSHSVIRTLHSVFGGGVEAGPIPLVRQIQIIRCLSTSHSLIGGRGERGADHPSCRLFALPPGLKMPRSRRSVRVVRGRCARDSPWLHVKGDPCSSAVFSYFFASS